MKKPLFYCVACFVFVVMLISSHLSKKYYDLFWLVPAPLIFLGVFGVLIFTFLASQEEINKNEFINKKIPGELDSSDLIIGLSRKVKRQKH